MSRAYTDPTQRDWGREDGSGLPIVGSFEDVLLPLLDTDLVGASKSVCGEIAAPVICSAARLKVTILPSTSSATTPVGMLSIIVCSSLFRAELRSNSAGIGFGLLRVCNRQLLLTIQFEMVINVFERDPN